MAHFYGESRQTLLKELLDRFHDLESGASDIPSIYILEGPSGVGKSHIIREFYETVRQRKIPGHSTYWPPLAKNIHASPRNSRKNPLANRKVLGPPPFDFTWEANALPTLLWLPLSFVNGDHLHFDVVREQVTSALDVHADAMFLSAKKKHSGFTAHEIEILRQKLRDLEANDVVEFSRDALLEVAGAFTTLIPGSGLAIQGLQQSVESLIRARRRRKALREKVNLGVTDASREAKLSEFVQDIRNCTMPGLPAVIVIEDLHWMDRDLPYFLTAIAQQDPKHPIMVIATAWPESRSSEVSAYAKWLDRALATNAAVVLDVPQIEEDALEAIIDSYAPASDPTLKKALVKGWSNPFCLELFLSWDSIAQCIQGEPGEEYLVLELDELSRMPTGIRDLYAARWNDIVANVQKVLIATAGTLPHSNAMHPFEIEVVAQVIASSDYLRTWAHLEDLATITPAESVTESLMTARNISWTMINGAGESFREPGLASVVIQHVSNEPSRITKALLEGVVAELEARILLMGDSTLVLNPQDADHVLAANWLLQVSPPGHGDAFTAARFLVARQQASSLNLLEALETLPTTLFMDQSQQEGPFTESFLNMRVEHDWWVADTGRTEEALELIQDTAAACERALGPDNQVTLAANVVLASRLGGVGRKTEALQTFQMLQARIAHLPSTPADFAAVVNIGVALWVGDIGGPGDAARAVELFNPVITEFTQKLGERALQVTEARRTQARFIGESKNTAEAVRVYHQLVADNREWFGWKSPLSFEARRGLGRWQLEDKQVPQALATYIEVERDCIEMFGPEHYLSLYATLGLGRAHIAAGQCEQARLTLDRLGIALEVYDKIHRLHEFYADALTELENCQSLDHP